AVPVVPATPAPVPPAPIVPAVPNVPAVPTVPAVPVVPAEPPLVPLVPVPPPPPGLPQAASARPVNRERSDTERRLYLLIIGPLSSRIDWEVGRAGARKRQLTDPGLQYSRGAGDRSPIRRGTGVCGGADPSPWPSPRLAGRGDLISD